MLSYLRLWHKTASFSLRSQMQYKGAFWLQVLGQLVIRSVDFLTIYMLFSRFGRLRDWSLPQVALLFGLIQIAFSLTEMCSFGIRRFGQIVRRGQFDRLLLRPRSTLFQLATEKFELRRLGGLLQGTVILLWAAWRLDVLRLSHLPLMLLAVGTGFCIFMGLFILQACLAFWTTDTLEIVNIVTYGGVETGSYPLSIYQIWFRRLFTFVIPLAFASYLPGIHILGHPDASLYPAYLAWLSFPVGLAFISLCAFAWRLGMRHYRSTGS